MEFRGEATQVRNGCAGPDLAAEVTVASWSPQDPGRTPASPSHPRATLAALGVALLVALPAVAQPADADDPAGATSAACVFGPDPDNEAIGRHLATWAEARGLGPLGTWGASFDRDRMSLRMALAPGELVVAWRLDPDCSPVDVEARAAPGFSADPPPAADARALADGFPAPVRAPRPPPGALEGGAGIALAAVLTALAALAGMLAWRRRRDVLPRLRRAAAAVALVLGGTLAGLAGAETAARLLDLDGRLLAAGIFCLANDPTIHRESADPFLHYELAPDTRWVGETPRHYEVDIDANGARFPAHDAAKAPGTFRILAFGGSTLYGGAVDDDQTLPAALERRLSAGSVPAVDGTPAVEVWNFGTSAYNLAQAAHLARSKLHGLSPDLVLVQVHNRFPRPFFASNGRFPREDLEPWAARDPDLMDEAFPGPEWLAPGGHAFAFAHCALYRAGIGLLRRHRQDTRDTALHVLLGQREARALVAEADAAGVPVLFLAIPADRGSLGPERAVYPDLPPERYVDLYRPGREPAFYEVHPPGPILDQYAGLLMADLETRGRLPGRPAPDSPGPAPDSGNPAPAP
jgi:hypothetical protein